MSWEKNTGNIERYERSDGQAAVWRLGRGWGRPWYAFAMAKEGRHHLEGKNGRAITFATAEAAMKAVDTRFPEGEES